MLSKPDQHNLAGLLLPWLNQAIKLKVPLTEEKDSDCLQRMLRNVRYYGEKSLREYENSVYPQLMQRHL